MFHSRKGETIIIERLAQRSVKLVCSRRMAQRSWPECYPLHNAIHAAVGFFFRHGWCHCNAIQPNADDLLKTTTGKGGSGLNFLPFQIQCKSEDCCSRSPRLWLSPLSWADSVIVGVVIFRFKATSHMHSHHLVIMYGENRPVCSIHSLSVLFWGAETIWRVVIRPCGGISHSSSRRTRSAHSVQRLAENWEWATLAMIQINREFSKTSHVLQKCPKIPNNAAYTQLHPWSIESYTNNIMAVIHQQGFDQYQRANWSLLHSPAEISGW